MERSHDERLLAELLAEDARERATAAGAGEGAPAAEDLLDLLEDRLAPGAAARLESRLAADPDAARDLLDLADLAAAERGIGSGAPAQVATHAGWRDFERRVGTSRQGRDRSGGRRWLGAMAAGLLLAAVGLGGWLGWTWRAGEDEPMVFASLESVELAADTRAAGETVIPLEPGAPLRLVLAPRERCESYRAVLTRTGTGEPGWQRTLGGLGRDSLGRLSLLTTVGPGAYELVLSGCQPRRELERHALRIVAPGARGQEGDAP